MALPAWQADRPLSIPLSSLRMPASTPPSQHHQTLLRIVAQSNWLMPALKAARGLGLESWCIGAGAIRNLVWDDLHGYQTPSALTDIDLAFFDPEATPGLDQELQGRLQQELAPGLPWEVTNQALVHTWFESYFGHAVEPLQSLEDAIATWPEFATSVGVSLDADDQIQVIAPHGLDDLFAMRVQRNPRRVSVETYRARVQEKRYKERWPRVTVLAL